MGILTFLRGLRGSTVRPGDLVGADRFDLGAKLLYVRATLSGDGREWAKEVYREHLRVWNGFRERAPAKNGFEQFVQAFDELIGDMGAGRFRRRASPIGLTSTGLLFNGAHRVAAAHVMDVRLTSGSVDHDIEPYDWRFFRDRRNHVDTGLTRPFLDAMALELVRWVPRHVTAIVIFPTSPDGAVVAKEEAAALGKSIYETSISVSGLGRYSFIHQLYVDEAWSSMDDPRSIIHKAEGCFPADTGEVTLLLIESSATAEEVTTVKERIRERLGQGKHSVHTTDTRGQAVRVAQLFCNENTEHTLNNLAAWPPPPRFREFFAEYDSLPPSEFRCIDSSAVLAVYGLRDARDIDYLYVGDHALEVESKNIGIHNAEIAPYVGSLDSVVCDPRNYFTWCGQKFASLETVARIKRQRAEPKDHVDLELIESVLTRT